MILRILLTLMLAASISCTDDKPPVSPASKGSPSAAAPAQRQPNNAGDNNKEDASSPPLPEGAFRPTTGAKTIKLLPEEAYVNTTFKLVARGITLPDGAAEDRVVWYINGSPVVSVSAGALDVSEHMPQKGDVVQAQAVIGDEEIFSNPVVMINYPPKIMKYELRGRVEDVSGGVYAYADVEDIDGDLISIEYRWFINDQPVGTGSTPDIQPALNDSVTVYIRAFDGEGYGGEVMAGASLLNQAPRIIADPAYYIVKGEYIYNTSANEPDGELITFGLESAPEGMTIDSETGQVRWKIPADFVGTMEYTVTATDTQDTTARLPLTFSVIQDK